MGEDGDDIDEPKALGELRRIIIKKNTSDAGILSHIFPLETIRFELLTSECDVKRNT